MTTPRHIPIPDELHEVVKAVVRAQQHDGGFLGDDPADELPDGADTPESALFADHDAVRGHGRGRWVADAAEARSRTIDAMQLKDPDTGPIALPPPDEDVDEAIELVLG